LRKGLNKGVEQKRCCSLNLAQGTVSKYLNRMRRAGNVSWAASSILKGLK